MPSCRYCHQDGLRWSPVPGGGYRLHTEAGERHHCPEQGAHVVALLKRVEEATRGYTDGPALAMRVAIHRALDGAGEYFNTGES